VRRLGLHGADPRILEAGVLCPQVPPSVLCCFFLWVYINLKVTSLLVLFTAPPLL
jgi:hypothetical protein